MMKKQVIHLSFLSLVYQAANAVTCRLMGHIVSREWFKSREQSIKGPYNTMEHLLQAVDAHIQLQQAEADLKEVLQKRH